MMSFLSKSLIRMLYIIAVFAPFKIFNSIIRFVSIFMVNFSVIARIFQKSFCN